MKLNVHLPDDIGLLDLLTFFLRVRSIFYTFGGYWGKDQENENGFGGSQENEKTEIDGWFSPDLLDELYINLRFKL